METQVKISIIVPVYNVEKYLKECIESLIHQTYTFTEMILVDDGSKDASGQICDAYADKDDRIRVIHKENQGLVSAWIDGTKMSTGEYLCYVDSDDWVEETMVEELVRETCGSRAEMICSNLWLEFGSSQAERRNQIAAGVYQGKELENIKSRYVLGNEQRTIMFSRCTKLIARKLIEDNIKFCDKSVRMGEDLNIILPALLDCERLVAVDGFYYHYRQSEDSMIHAYDANMYAGICRLTKIIYHILEQKGITDCERLTAKEYIFLLILVIKNELRGNKDYVNAVQKICKDNRNREVLRKNRVVTENKANRLILFVMKHPNRIFWKVLRKLIVIKG